MCLEWMTTARGLIKSPPLESFYGIAGKAAWTKLPLSAVRHGDETPIRGEIADDYSLFAVDEFFRGLVIFVADNLTKLCPRWQMVPKY